MAGVAVSISGTAWGGRERAPHRRGARLARGFFAALLLTMAVQACAPTVVQRGTATREAALDGDRFIADDGTLLRYRTWLPQGPPRAVLIAVHGMNEYSRAFEWPAETWQGQGIAVYAFDQRGFGDSPDRGIWAGTENLSSDLAAFARLVNARHPGLPLYLLGESMGAAVVLLTAAREDLVPLDGIILVAPAAAPWEELPVHWRAALWLMAHTVPWLPMTGRGLDLRPTDNIDVWREMSLDDLVIHETRVDALYGLTQLMDQAAAAVPRVRFPALLLYGAKDDFVRDWMVSWVVENAPAGQFDVASYDQGYHWLLRDLAAEQVLGDILDWIDGSPSGRRRDYTTHP